MTIPKTKIASPFYVKFASVLLILLILGYLSVLGKSLLSPLLYAFLFAMLLFPVTRNLENRFNLPTGLAATVAIILLMAVVTLIFIFVGSQLASLTKDWPQFQQEFKEMIVGFQRWVSAQFHVGIKQQLEYVNSATDSLMSSGTSILGTTVLSVSSILLFIVFTIIYTFLLLIYRRLLVRFLVAAFKAENEATVREVLEEVQYIIQKYIVGLLLQMAIVTLACCIAFSIIGIKYAIFLGFLTGILNIVPYIGIFTALVLSTLITIGSGALTTTVLLVIATIIVIHMLDSNILLPAVVGSKVKINALITLLGVIVGEMMWGISGMFLSIPLIAIGKIVFDRVESLKPWGILLGEEKLIKVKKADGKKKVRSVEAPSLEQDLLKE